MFLAVRLGTISIKRVFPYIQIHRWWVLGRRKKRCRFNADNGQK